MGESYFTVVVLNEDGDDLYIHQVILGEREQFEAGKNAILKAAAEIVEAEEMS